MRAKNTCTQYWGHTLGLEGDPEKIMSGFRATTRRNIRKAEREGVTTEILTSLSAVKEFYRLYCITRKHQGLPPQPWAFFESIHKHLISVGCGFVVLATFQGEIVAGAFFLHFGNKAIYKYAAWKREYQHLRQTILLSGRQSSGTVRMVTKACPSEGQTWEMRGCDGSRKGGVRMSTDQILSV